MEEFSGPARRPTRRGYEEVEAEHFVRELEEGGAYVSPGVATPWRGLEGHDPFDDEDPEERSERYWREWHEASENDEERPPRRPVGRARDIEPPFEAPVITRVDPEIARRYAERQAQQRATVGEPATYETAGGVVTVDGLTKVWRGPCARCSQPWEQRRPVSQRQRWRTLCSEVCKKAWDRERARDRKRRQRGNEAA
ncbi:hypothetical protein ACWCPM_12515 [Streptomyces sp. NPDC002309]